MPTSRAVSSGISCPYMEMCTACGANVRVEVRQGSRCRLLYSAGSYPDLVELGWDLWCPSLSLVEQHTSCHQDMLLTPVRSCSFKRSRFLAKLCQHRCDHWTKPWWSHWWVPCRYSRMAVVSLWMKPENLLANSLEVFPRSMSSDGAWDATGMAHAPQYYIHEVF